MAIILSTLKTFSLSELKNWEDYHLIIIRLFDASQYAKLTSNWVG